MPARGLLLILLFAFSFCLDNNAKGSIAAGNKISQSKLNYLKLEIRKIKQDQLLELITELNSYEDKVHEAYFDETSRQLTVWYTQSISVVDIMQIVAKYTTDFTKISGTEL